MDADELFTLLNSPKELFYYPEDKLDQLVETYPYCQNLIMMATIKKQWTDEKSFKKYEELAATHSIDRSFLRLLLLKSKTLTFDPMPIGQAVSDEQIVEIEDDSEIEEAFIEFPSLNKLEKQSFVVPGSLDIPEEVEKQSDFEAINQLTIEWDHIANIDELQAPLEPEIVVPETPPEVPINDRIEIISSKPVEKQPIEKQPSEEELLRKRLKVLEAELAVIKDKLKISDPKPKPKKQKEKNKNRPNTPKAQRSLEKSDSIISETLAKILEKQGYFKRSKKMYEQLSLIFPEKSGYFAEKIEKIEKLIINKK